MPDGEVINRWRINGQREWIPLELSFSDTAEKRCPLNRSKNIVDKEDEEDEE